MHDQKRLKVEKGHVLAYREDPVMMAGKAGYWECEADMGIRKQRDHIHPHTGSGGRGQEVGPGSTGIPPPALPLLPKGPFTPQTVPPTRD